MVPGVKFITSEMEQSEQKINWRDDCIAGSRPSARFIQYEKRKLMLHFIQLNIFFL